MSGGQGTLAAALSNHLKDIIEGVDWSLDELLNDGVAFSVLDY